MKKFLIGVSGLVMMVGAGFVMAEEYGWDQKNLPAFEDVDTNKDSMISMDEAKASPDLVNAVTNGKPETADDSLKSFFSAAHEQDKDKPYDSPISKEEWEGLTND
ncbi:MAG: hypothetical protein H6970_11980 [Gammaproteobacteria bacterium]|nr:hypothetical protein [Gammaproteobacteria bacterium]MCP5425765.1 hypothetical protein [Gammaproteobacteria bacterium]MCP5458624.1 hypothetical protein [Gammaproteobacteria bacterium]